MTAQSRRHNKLLLLGSVIAILAFVAAVGLFFVVPGPFETQGESSAASSPSVARLPIRLGEYKISDVKANSVVAFFASANKGGEDVLRYMENPPDPSVQAAIDTLYEQRADGKGTLTIVEMYDVWGDGTPLNLIEGDGSYLVKVLRRYDWGGAIGLVIKFTIDQDGFMVVEASDLSYFGV